MLKLHNREKGKFWNEVKKRLFFAILASIILYGCGYTARSVLPADESLIYVDNFVSKINVTREISNRRVYYPYSPGMEIDITRKVIDRFIFDGTFKVRDAESAYYILKGKLVNFKREPLRYDANDNVIEYRLSVVVDIELYDLKKEEVAWYEKNFAGEDTYRTTGQFAKSESVALQGAISDLARRIVERVVENW